jgi:hypothetical protein
MEKGNGHMYTSEQARMMMELFSNPIFRQGAGEFFSKLQQDGMESAKKFWGASPYAAALPDSQQMVERMADFYSAIGFVPLAKHEAALKENESLKSENKLLRDTIRELQQSFMAEGGVKAQQAWQSVIEKQIELNREATTSFFDALKQFNPPK